MSLESAIRIDRPILTTVPAKYHHGTEETSQTFLHQREKETQAKGKKLVTFSWIVTGVLASTSILGGGLDDGETRDSIMTSTPSVVLVVG